MRVPFSGSGGCIWKAEETIVLGLDQENRKGASLRWEASFDGVKPEGFAVWVSNS